MAEANDQEVDIDEKAINDTIDAYSEPTIYN